MATKAFHITVWITLSSVRHLLREALAAGVPKRIINPSSCILYRCPTCKHPLHDIARHELQCANGHTVLRAKERHVHLLPSGRKAPRQPSGDSDAMVHLCCTNPLGISGASTAFNASNLAICGHSQFCGCNRSEHGGLSLTLAIMTP